MPHGRTFVVTRILNLYQSSKRGLAFIQCPEDKSLDAKRIYDKLNDKKQRIVKNRFDHWLQGQTHDPYFHGWSEPNYRRCFVFKWKDQGVDQRFYGFLMNPKERTNRSFQVCILFSHAQKSEKNTDPAQKNKANNLRQDQRVSVAVKQTYPESDLH